MLVTPISMYVTQCRVCVQNEHCRLAFDYLECRPMSLIAVLRLCTMRTFRVLLLLSLWLLLLLCVGSFSTHRKYDRMREYMFVPIRVAQIVFDRIEPCSNIRLDKNWYKRYYSFGQSENVTLTRVNQCLFNKQPSNGSGLSIVIAHTGLCLLCCPTLNNRSSATTPSPHKNTQMVHVSIYPHQMLSQV